MRLLLFLVADATAVATPRRPFPQHVAYAAGTIAPDHRAQSQQDADVRAYYDAWKASYLLAAGPAADGGTLYRVSFGATNPARTVSEGQGYGMMIVACMAGHDQAAQTLFDGLWKFARKYPSGIDSRLMAWQVPLVEAQNASAFDGDNDIAYALLLADAQWGSDGSINYRAAALQVIAGILGSTIGPDSRLPTLGDWVQFNGEKHNQYTPRSSDFMPTHFRAFRQATGDAVWGRVVEEVQRVIGSIQANHSPTTGLLPDFIVMTAGIPRPAPPDFLEKPVDGAYSYNAGRDPWRLGADALLNSDATSLAQTQRMARWILAATGGDPLRIRAGYLLDGTPLPGSDYFTSFFAAPFGVAAMTEPSQQRWLNAIYDSVYARHEGYYEDSVTLLSLLVMTRNSWQPGLVKGKRRAVVR